MHRERDGYSDNLFEAGTTLLQIYPPDDGALKEIKKFIAKHCLTKEEVKIIKNENGMFCIAKIDVTLTMLHTGGADEPE